MHKDLVEYLSGNKRKEVLDRNIDHVLSGWVFDNYSVEDLTKSIDDAGNLNIRVDLSTPNHVIDRIENNSGLVTVESLIAESIRIAEELDRI